MKIIFFRNWVHSPGFGSFSDLPVRGIGGTEFQLLLHARAFLRRGHEVVIAGITSDDREEEGATLIGAPSKDRLAERLSRSAQDADVVLINSTDDLPLLRRCAPKATFVQVCQNGPHFHRDGAIDLYAFVGPGQLAYYSARFRDYRHKFVPLFNVPPIRSVYQHIEDAPKRDQVIWVGALEKQGFRRWATAMERILAQHSSLKWIVCAPNYSRLLSGSSFPALIADLHLPKDRVHFKNLPLRELAGEIKQSKLLMASLGGEDGPVSYLDGHALGVPVLCGDDIIGLYANPPGVGIRCTTTEDCYNALHYLLTAPDLAEEMGSLGKKWVSNYNEELQADQIDYILNLTSLMRKYGVPFKSTKQSDKKFPLRYWMERLAIKLVEKGHIRGNSPSR